MGPERDPCKYENLLYDKGYIIDPQNNWSFIKTKKIRSSHKKKQKSTTFTLKLFHVKGKNPLLSSRSKQRGRYLWSWVKESRQDTKCTNHNKKV